MPKPLAQIVMEEGPDTSDDDYMRVAQQRSDDEVMDRFYERLRRSERERGSPPAEKTQDDQPQDPRTPQRPKTVEEQIDWLQRGMKGFREIGTAVPGGMTDAANATLNLIDTLDDGLAKMGLQLPGYDPSKPPDQLPEIVSDPETPEGKFARGIAQFLTGFIPALKMTRGLTAVPGLAGQMLNSAAAGALADFIVVDGTEKKLADLWKDMGLPENIVTDFLASAPDDTEMEGRFKRALEGVIVGVPADTLLHAGRLIRSVKRGVERVVPGAAERAAAKQVLRDADAAVASHVGRVTNEHLATLGDPTKPLFEVKQRRAKDKIKKAEGETADLTAEDIVGMPGKAQIGTKEVYFNFSRMDTSENIQKVLAGLIDAQHGAINEARRGVQTHKETERLAARLGMTVEDILARRKGSPMAAEEAVAARALLNASVDVLLDAAEKAISPNAGEIDRFIFNKMKATHGAIQKEVIAARTDTARALNAWKIPVGEAERLKFINDTMLLHGHNAEEFALRLLALRKVDAKKDAIERVITEMNKPPKFARVKEFWINGILSSPQSHMVNITSNSVVAGMQIYERRFAEIISQMEGNPNGVAPGEAAAQMHGLLQAIPDMFRAFGKSLITGETGAVLGKAELPFDRAITGRHMKNPDSTMAQFVDYLGTSINVPSRLLGAEDEFFKSGGYRMELYAQANRVATSEGLTGKAFQDRYQEVIRNPPENIRLDAVDAALYNTFTNNVEWFGRAMMRLRPHQRPWAATWLALPFVRTVSNVASYTFERFPGVAILNQRFRSDIAAGGARRQIALARQATGTMLFTMAMDWADRGIITGGGEFDPQRDRGLAEAERRTGREPDSIIIGGRSYSYRRIDPLGTMFGVAARMSEAMKRYELDDEDMDEWHELTAAAIMATGKTILTRQYLSGIADLTDAVTDPTRYSEGYVNDLIASFAPFTSLSGAVARAQDPELKDVQTPWEAIQSRLPELVKGLTPRRDLWGEAFSGESGLGTTFDFFSPVTSKPIKDSPIDQEIMRLRVNIGRINKKSSFSDGFGGSVDINFRQWPEVYDEYIQLAGNDLKHPAYGGLGAKEFLDDLVTGQSPYSAAYQIGTDGPEGGKAKYIRDVIRTYREQAQRKILSDPRFADFREHVRQLWQQKLDAKMSIGQ